MKTNHLAAMTVLGIMLVVSFLLCGKNASSASWVLDEGETQHLIFMRLEEKLARDVYITLGNQYAEEAVFSNIVSSEQKHTDAVEKQLAHYDVDDPINDPKTDDPVGVFFDPVFGEYFSARFNGLVAWGMENALEGLYVGAFIEELDMLEIVHCPEFIVETFPNIDDGECGLDYTDEKALIKTYGNLLGGSEEHLRAYVRNIEKIIGEGNYVAQVLTQEEVDRILGR